MIAGVDLGKTSARLRIVGATTHEQAGEGCPGLAEQGAVARVVARVEQLLAGAPGEPVDRLVVGVPGAEAHPEAAAEAARLLAAIPGVGAAYVLADSCTAHAGALHGAAGAVLSAGTGAVALALDADGAFHQRDGWGQWLGDDGSGSWIGRAGLRQALLHAEHRGGSARLLDAARQLFGPPAQIPALVARDGNPGGRLASFAPRVLEAAHDGDAVAAQVLHEAGVLLGRTLASAAEVAGEPRVAVVGGLAGVPEIRDPLLGQVTGCDVVEQPGTGLDGAVLLADGRDHQHLTRAHRAGGA